MSSIFHSKSIKNWSSSIDFCLWYGICLAFVIYHGSYTCQPSKAFKQNLAQLLSLHNARLAVRAFRQFPTSISIATASTCSRPQRALFTSLSAFAKTNRAVTANALFTCYNSISHRLSGYRENCSTLTVEWERQNDEHCKRFDTLVQFQKILALPAAHGFRIHRDK